MNIKLDKEGSWGKINRKFLTKDVDSYCCTKLEINTSYDKKLWVSHYIKLADCNKIIEMYFDFDKPSDISKLNTLIDMLQEFKLNALKVKEFCDHYKLGEKDE